MNKKCVIGLVGYGTVGSGVYELIRRNAGLIALRTGVELRIKTICDLRIDLVKSQTDGVEVIDSWRDLIADPEIDVVVELIGGIKPAKDIVLAALENGKSVVTANKKLLAEEAADVFSALDKSTGYLGFEASVGGGIPCLAALREGLVGNRVCEVMGILNGTTNYILTMMDRFGLDFASALAQAQEKGFAEADPTFDIEGNDAGHKITLLSMLAYNKNVNYKNIDIEGITRITPLDISFAREMGYVIKLLGIGKMVDGELDVRVHPTMVRNENPLASVQFENNAVMVAGDMTGPVIFYGKGAGSLPTASAVVGDIVRIGAGTVGEKSIVLDGDAAMLSGDRRTSRYYLRMETDDRAGILEKIAGVFSKNDISIASVVQKENSSGSVPLVIVTHRAIEANLMKSVNDINAFPFIREKVMLIRIEDALAAGV